MQMPVSHKNGLREGLIDKQGSVYTFMESLAYELLWLFEAYCNYNCFVY